MTTTTDPIEAIRETAALLACAVADRDQQLVAETLTVLDVPELYALAVALAASVDPDSPLMSETVVQSPETIADRAIAAAAELFRTTPGQVLSYSRAREDCEARQVAMAACRRAGLTSVAVGAAFGRDHSTVLYAVTRVGEDRRLRRAARRVTNTIDHAYTLSAA